MTTFKSKIKRPKPCDTTCRECKRIATATEDLLNDQAQLTKMWEHYSKTAGDEMEPVKAAYINLMGMIEERYEVLLYGGKKK